MLTKIVFLVILSSLSTEIRGQGGLEYLKDAIPGEPGVDYPVFNSVQSTDFSCEDKVFGGYYADPQMGCQAYHVCLADPQTGSQYPVSFLCPNGTIFQQAIFNCDWWYNVDCSKAESLYGLAANAFGTSGGIGGDVGTCPAANPLSQAECEGTVSTCWSPGQRDTDCPNFGLCCFDGCQDTCADGPAQSGSGILPVAQNTPRPAPPRRPTTTRPRPRPTPSRPRPTPRPQPSRPSSIQIDLPTFEAVEIEEEEEGYNYPVPSVTLPVRPKPTTPSGLYQIPHRGK